GATSCPQPVLPDAHGCCSLAPGPGTRGPRSVLPGLFSSHLSVPASALLGCWLLSVMVFRDLESPGSR
ncbi:Hypothetical predicted protein, partial [Marmota monax]